MTPNTKSASIADYYFGFLQNLNSEIKLDLISKLSHSINEIEQKPTISIQSLFGAYQSEESADDIIKEIRNSRVFNRNIESL